MQLSQAVAIVSVLQAASALPSLYELSSLPRSLDIEDLIYRRDVVGPLSRRMAPNPTLEYTTQQHGYTNPASQGSTIDSKLSGGMPDQLHPLPQGQTPTRPDMTGHGSRADNTVMDHAIPVGSQEGETASKAGQNPQMLVPRPQQNSEGGRTNAAFGQARAQDPNNPPPVDVRIDGKPPSAYQGGSGAGGPPSSNTRYGNRRRSLDAHIYARNAAAEAYAEALAVFDSAVEMQVQRRDPLAFADPEVFVF